MRAKILLIANVLFFACGSFSLLERASAQSESQLVIVEGAYELMVDEYIDEQNGKFDPEGVSHRAFLITTGGRRYTLLFRATPPALLSGSRIRVRGRIQGPDGLFIEAYEVISEVNPGRPPEREKSSRLWGIAPAYATAGQPRRVAVLLAKFQDYQTEPFSADRARELMFTDAQSVNSYFREASFDQYPIAGEVYGWYTIPYNVPADCSTFAWYQFWDRTLEAVARPHGFSAGNNDSIIYFYALPARCGTFGSGTVGGQPATIHMHAASFPLGVVMHELGHNIGLSHSNGRFCRDAGNQPVAVSNNCRSLEYIDGFDVMGGNQGHFNSFQKGRLGWIPPARVRDITATGDYVLAPMNRPSVGAVQSLRVPIQLNTAGQPIDYYYIEYRQPTTFDQFPGNSIFSGVTIRKAPPYVSPPGTQLNDFTSYLLDTTPHNENLSDAALLPQRWFEDQEQSIGIHVLGVEPHEARVRVTVGPTIIVYNRGSADGMVVSSVGGIQCRPGSQGTCLASFQPGANVTLTAVPGAGVGFQRWSNACNSQGTTPTCTLVANGIQHIGAQFYADNVRVTKSGNGRGTITTSSPGIHCGNDCSGLFHTNNFPLTLSATPTAGSRFRGWSGACQGTSPTCQIQVQQSSSAGEFAGDSTGSGNSFSYDTQYNVIASFEEIPVATVRVSVSGSGGKVVSSAAGIDCGSRCSASLPRGTAVTLSVVSTLKGRSLVIGSQSARRGLSTLPSRSSITFTGWRGVKACERVASTTCTFILNRDESLSATFAD